MKNCEYALLASLLMVPFGCSSNASSETDAASGAKVVENQSSAVSSLESNSASGTDTPADSYVIRRAMVGGNPPISASPDSAAGGSERPSSEASTSETESVLATVATPKRLAPKEVTLELMEWEGINRIIQSHQGKVVVVDCWATYCVPCRKEFPGLVKLSQEFPSDVVCISVSLDEAADRDAALDFLKEQKSQLTNLLCTTDTDTLYDQILKVGSVPAIFVYGRDGAIARTFTGASPDGGEYTYAEHIAPFVQELVSQK